jgi:hypothetical protein
VKRTAMQAALQSSSLYVLLILVTRVLTREGYDDVQILDRRQTKQKSRFGGHEIMCETTIGSMPAKVVVKVINDAGRARHLDELAGVVDRIGADVGLLVTPHHLTKNARRNQPLFSRSRIEVMDGPGFASLLLKHKIGTRGQDGVDYAFFGHLEQITDRFAAFKEDLR